MQAPSSAIALDVDEDETSAAPVLAWLVDASQHRQRLDRVFADRVPDFSRSHCQALIELGAVAVDGVAALSCAKKLVIGQQVEARLIPTAQSQSFQPERMNLSVEYEDEALLVVNKPAGLVVHPAAGHWRGTLMNGLLAHHPGAATLPRAGLVHRLDKDTSGLMVVAKTLQAMTLLVRAIAERSVQRDYLALAHERSDWLAARQGQASEHFSVAAAIARDPVSRVRMAVRAHGKPARTDFARLAWSEAHAASAWHCKLHTGRTHQIRVHAASIGLPLVGDALYGGQPSLGMKRQALHAWRLGFAHPLSSQALQFAVSLPSDMQQAWQLAGGPWPPSAAQLGA